MNKYGKVIVAFLCFVNLGFNINADEMYSFVTNVNNAWATTNYSQILQFVNNRLTQYPDDVLALGVKQSYFFICDVNISNAHIAANALLNAAQQTGRADIIPFVDDMTYLMLQLPVTSTWSYTQMQIDLQHTGGGEKIFPGIFMPTLIARRLEQPATNYPAITVESMPTNGVYIDISGLDNFLRGSTNTPYTRVYSPNKEITLTAPPNSGTNTFLKWSSDGTNTIGLTTNIIFTMVSNITAIAVYESD